MSGQLAQPVAVLEWLQMGYRPLGPYASSGKASVATADSLPKISRGNMIPVWNFLLKRVKSEETVENIRRNIIVHGKDDGLWIKGRRREELRVGKEGLGDNSSRELALQERELAEKEVERLRQIVRRQRKQLKAKMIEVPREEAERKRMLDDRSNYRTTNFCLSLAVEHDEEVTEKWLPELKIAVVNAQKCLDDCKYVRALLDEWWEQPASTVVWVAVDGRNICAWQNHVKQLLAFYDK